MGTRHNVQYSTEPRRCNRPMPCRQNCTKLAILLGGAGAGRPTKNMFPRFPVPCECHPKDPGGLLCAPQGNTESPAPPNRLPSVPKEETSGFSGSIVRTFYSNFRQLMFSHYFHQCASNSRVLWSCVQLDWRSWIVEWTYTDIFAVTIRFQNKDQFWISHQKKQGRFI